MIEIGHIILPLETESSVFPGSPRGESNPIMCNNWDAMSVYFSSSYLVRDTSPIC